MQTYTLPDITPGGTKVALSTVIPTTSANRAIWINMTATGSTIRYGDVNVGSGQGQVLPTGIPFLTHPRGDNPQQPYMLSQVYVYGSGGDKVSITYGY